MESMKQSSRLDWIFFLGSLAVCIGLLAFADEWFWLALPFVLTYFVKALNVI